MDVLKNQLRPAVHAAAPAGTSALTGGTTAVSADIQKAVNHDYAVVFPAAAVIILLRGVGQMIPDLHVSHLIQLGWIAGGLRDDRTGI